MDYSPPTGRNLFSPALGSGGEGLLRTLFGSILYDGLNDPDMFAFRSYCRSAVAVDSVKEASVAMTASGKKTRGKGNEDGQLVNENYEVL